MYICKVIKYDGAFSLKIKESNTMNPDQIYNGLDFTTRQINFTFKIKVNGFNFQCSKHVNTLVGVSGLIDLIGIDLTNKLLKRAFDCKKDKEVCKLRRGLKITFYYH